MSKTDLERRHHLIGYLKKKQDRSPFESASLAFLGLADQAWRLHRHKAFNILDDLASAAGLDPESL